MKVSIEFTECIGQTHRIYADVSDRILQDVRDIGGDVADVLSFTFGGDPQASAKARRRELMNRMTHVIGTMLQGVVWDWASAETGLDPSDL